MEEPPGTAQPEHVVSIHYRVLDRRRAALCSMQVLWPVSEAQLWSPGCHTT